MLRECLGENKLPAVSAQRGSHHHPGEICLQGLGRGTGRASAWSSHPELGSDVVRGRDPWQSPGQRSQHVLQWFPLLPALQAAP